MPDCTEFALKEFPELEQAEVSREEPTTMIVPTETIFDLELKLVTQFSTPRQRNPRAGFDGTFTTSRVHLISIEQIH
jgi:hypothetical protein